MKAAKKKNPRPNVKHLLEVLEGWDGKLEGIDPPEMASFRAAMAAVKKSMHKAHKRSATLRNKTLRAIGRDPK